MKKSLKIGLFLVLALLIHCNIYGITEEMCEACSPNYRQEQCYLSQSTPIRDTLEHICNLYPTQSCDMSHTDIAHVPTEKSFLLPMMDSGEHYDSQHSFLPSSLHFPTYFYDPISYYIYGLRKIVV